ADQVDDVVGVARVERDADAGRHEDFLALRLERLADRAEQPASELGDLVDELAHVRGARDEHGELVAGKTARDRALVELRLNSAREDFEALIADRVAERVVDVLEAVDVEIEQRD